jgi:hypothetical protein
MQVGTFEGGDGMNSSGEGRVIFDDQYLDWIQVTPEEAVHMRRKRGILDG